MTVPLQVEWRTPKGPQYRRAEIKRRRFLFTVDRPWTQEFLEANKAGQGVPEVIVEPYENWPFFK